MASPLAGGPQVSLAGIIAAPLPRLTPPSSLNVSAPLSNVTLSTPFNPSSNPVPLAHHHPPSPSSNAPPPPHSHHPNLIGLGGTTLTQLSPQTPPASLSPQTSAGNPTNTTTSPVYDL